MSQYENPEPAAGPTNLFQATSNDLTLRGFRGSGYLHLMAAVQRVARRTGRIAVCKRAPPDQNEFFAFLATLYAVDVPMPAKDRFADFLRYWIARA